MAVARRDLKSLLGPMSMASYGVLLLLALTTGLPVFVTASCDIVSAQPQLYGRLQNKEVLPKELWFPSYGPLRRKDFKDYLHQNASAVNAPGGPSLPINAGCPLLVNDKYKIVFLKNTKTAGSSLLRAFGFSVWGDCDTCLRKVRDDEEPELLQGYRDYFVFTIVRNPFDRAVSSYEYILSLRMMSHSVAAHCPPPTFQEFCKRPYVLGLQDRTSDCYPKATGTRVPMGAGHDFVHVEPMSKCLLSSTGKPSFDYAIRMDKIRDDFEIMRLHHLNTPERRKNGVPDLPELDIGWANHGPIETTGNAVAMNRHMSHYVECGGECVSSIANYYAQDLELFGYPTNETECLVHQRLEETYQGTAGSAELR